MSYRADKQVIDTHTDRYTDRGDDNTRRPELASGKKLNILSTSNMISRVSNDAKALFKTCQQIFSLVNISLECISDTRKYHDN